VLGFEKFMKYVMWYKCWYVPKTLFIVPTDAHYYKNHRMLKKVKIIKII